MSDLSATLDVGKGALGWTAAYFRRSRYSLRFSSSEISLAKVVSKTSLQYMLDELEVMREKFRD